MRCLISSAVLILSVYVYVTDAQKKMKGKVHVMQDEELASLLGELHQSHQKITTIPLQSSKIRNLPFVRKQPSMRTKNLSHEQEGEAMNPKAHYTSDAEIEAILSNLNAPENSNSPLQLEKFEPYELNEDKWEPSVLNQPQSNINIDRLPLQEYSKVYLVVNPEAVKNTENQKTLTDLIGKVMAARRSHRRDDYAAAEKYGDRDDRREDKHNRDFEYDRKESKHERESSRQTNQVAASNSRTARPISRGVDRENRKFSDFDD